MKVVRTYDTRAQAVFFKTALESFGINSVIVAPCANAEPGLEGRCNLEVQEHEEELARNVLAVVENGMGL